MTSPKRVPGAPFQVGHRVRVVKLLDDNPGLGTLGKVGVVVALIYDSGVGQEYPTMPIVEIRWEGTHITAQYWPEELDLVMGD